ncbi:MAG: hypothetical protein ACPGVH_06375 [Chitinophagales bacterium]
MKKFNITLAAIIFTAVLTLTLSSCHRNTCPTWNKVDVDTEVRS